MASLPRSPANDPESEAVTTGTSSSGVRPRVDPRDQAALIGDAFAVRDISVYVPPPLETPHAEPVVFTVEFPRDSHFFAGLSHDLASGGIFVATYRTLPIGTRVRVRFSLPEGTTIDAGGHVRWVREQDTAFARRGLAIAFSEMDGEALRSVSEYCRLRPPLLLDLD